jgi:hypothetical protein
MTTSSPSPQPARDPRDRAYDVGARMARERIAREAPEDAEVLSRVDAADLVVVTGVYDHVERVLDALETPFTRVAPDQLPEVRLRPEQLLVVNCPGQIGDDQVRMVRDFVAAGGSLFTTDWALRHVVQPGFPGTIEHTGRVTADDVVPIEVLDHDNPFLAGVMDGGDEPQWWLEGSSYPITIVDHDRVRVLIASRRLERRYGEAPVAVLFPWGDGEVFHMVSHYYLQRTELRNERHRAGASAYWAEKSVPVPADLAEDLDGLALGEVESAAGSSRLMANVIADKKRRAIGWRAPDPSAKPTSNEDGDPR